MESFSYAQPDFFAEMNTLLGESDLETWKAYLRWNLINAAAPYLSDEIVERANMAAYYAGDDGRSEVRMIIRDAQDREQRRQFVA